MKFYEKSETVQQQAPNGQVVNLIQTVTAYKLNTSKDLREFVDYMAKGAKILMDHDLKDGRFIIGVSHRPANITPAKEMPKLETK